MKKNDHFDWLALCFLLFGGFNWGLVGLFKFNLIAAILKENAYLAQLIYALIGASAVYLTLAFAIPPDDNA